MPRYRYISSGGGVIESVTNSIAISVVDEIIDTPEIPSNTLIDDENNYLMDDSNNYLVYT